MLRFSEHISGNTLVINKSMAGRTDHLMVIPLDIKSFTKCLSDWKSGMTIQNAFPMLNDATREFIKTGITPEEWKKLFG